jgi:RNA polymerase sigma-70 factor (ECF subfamily)
MDIKEYNLIVDKYSDDLFRFALRYTGDEDESNDAVQDSFVTLWEHHWEVGTDGAKGYFMRVLYRRLVNRYRQRKKLAREEMIPGESYNPHNDYELHDSIEKMLATLTGEQRMLLLLRDLEGYSYKEMAEMTGLSEQQVMTYLYRARVKARKYLTENR